MPSDLGKESAERLARRKWGNNDITKSFLEEREKLTTATPVDSTPKMAEVLEPERVKADKTTKFERKFLKEIRSMLQEHQNQNLRNYKLYLQAQIIRLKRAKLKKLMARERERQANPSTKAQEANNDQP